MGRATRVAFLQGSQYVKAQDDKGKVLTWHTHSGALVSEKVSNPIIPISGQQLAISPNGRYRLVIENEIPILVSSEPNHYPVAEQLADLRHWKPIWHPEQALLAEKEGNAFAAAFHLRRMLKRQPWDARAHVRLGHALSRQKKHAVALTHFLQGVLLDPKVDLKPVEPTAPKERVMPRAD